MIEVRGLRKRHTRGTRPALDGIGFTVPTGSLFGLLGPNGAGKTTLISIIAGLIGPDEGQVLVDREAVTGPRTGAIGYCPQQLAFYPGLSVRENLRLFADICGGVTREALDFAIAAGDLGTHLDKRAHALSGGLQRRLNFAIALLQRPRLLLLDEPTAGMDPQSRNFLLEAIARLRAEGTTVVYCTHYMEEIDRLCDRLAILDRGRLLACDTIEALRATPDERLDSMFLRLTHARLRDDD